MKISDDRKLLEEVKKTNATHFAILSITSWMASGAQSSSNWLRSFICDILIREEADQKVRSFDPAVSQWALRMIWTKYYGLNKEDNPQVIRYRMGTDSHISTMTIVFSIFDKIFSSATFEKLSIGNQKTRTSIWTMKAGNSDYPLNVIKKQTVDMEKERLLNAAFSVFCERRLDNSKAYR